MREKEIRELVSAYNQVYQLDENSSSVDEGYKSSNKERIERQTEKAYKTERRALDKGDADEAMRQNRRRNAMNNPAGRRNELAAKNKNKPTTQNAHFEPEMDLFDYLLEYLVAEGYADTNKAALAIMANMSEEWKQSIVEQKKDDLEAPDYKDAKRIMNQVDANKRSLYKGDKPGIDKITGLPVKGV